MAMGRTIINEFSCILIVFVMFAIMASSSNCEANRHLLQTGLVDSVTGVLTTANVTVIDVAALTSILNIRLVQNDIFLFILNATLNDVGGYDGFLILSRNGTLTGGSLLAFGPLNHSLNGTVGNGTVDGTVNEMLIGVSAINGSLILGTNGTINGSMNAFGPFNLIVNGTLTENGLNGSSSLLGPINITFQNGTLNVSGRNDALMYNVTLNGNGTLNGSVDVTLVGVGTLSVTFLPVNVTIIPTLV